MDHSVWALDQTSGNTSNEIRSVGLTPTGGFAAGTDQHEIWLPFLPAYDYSMPVADISFSPSGRMLLGERGIYALSYPMPHFARALEYVKGFGSVTVLNGHIHQVMQKVEGNVTFHTARSTAFPQPAPGSAPSPGPMKVADDKLRTMLGVASINFKQNNQPLAIIDTPLQG